MSEQYQLYTNDDYISLCNKAPNVNDIVRHCDDNVCSKNYEISTVKWSIDNEFEWLLHLQCQVCLKKWNICATCQNFKVRIINKRQLSNHKNTYHKIKMLKKRKIDNTNNAKQYEFVNSLSCYDSIESMKINIDHSSPDFDDMLPNQVTLPNNVDYLPKNEVELPKLGKYLPKLEDKIPNEKILPKSDIYLPKQALYLPNKDDKVRKHEDNLIQPKDLVQNVIQLLSLESKFNYPLLQTNNDLVMNYNLVQNIDLVLDNDLVMYNDLVKNNGLLLNNENEMCFYNLIFSFFFILILLLFLLFLYKILSEKLKLSSSYYCLLI